MMQTLYADLPLARRYTKVVDQILVDYVRVIASLKPESGATTIDVGDGFALYHGKGTPPGPNRVTGLGMFGPVTEEHLQKAEEFYGERGLPCVVGIAPLADPSVAQLTASRGYGLGTFRNVLARPIEKSMAGAALLPDPQRLDITVEPASPSEAELWALVAGSGSAGTELDTPPISRLATLKCSNTVCYLARIDGKVAGAGVLTIVDGFAYIWDTSTRPAYRRRGVQTAMYLALLKDAARAGCDMAGIATEVAHVSQRNAERVGFRVIFTAAAVVRPIPGTTGFEVV